ncbi:MAG TPA: co-chaperone GroES [Candidatus Saccharimonas sp.]|nr:co-chaperone GroES [Candidatus Saccharimonas sp.]
MSTAIKPLADRIVATREEAQSKTASGLYLPEAAKEQSTLAKVIAVGPEVKYLKVGDRIIYKQYAQSLAELKIDGEKFISVRESAVIATI